MHNLLPILFLLAASTTHAGGFQRGVDISFLPQVEQGGGVFRQDGVPEDLFFILQSQGLNTIRLRLWHTPLTGHSGLPETLFLAERAKAADMDILLDFHYSDIWGDPGSQGKPRAWDSLSISVLADSMRAYTRDVLSVMIARDVAPSMVQLGNEITAGILWDDGRVAGPYNTPEQWSQLNSLLLAASEGVAEAFSGLQAPEIMIHVDRGADNAGARWFFDNLLAQGFDFDVIGLSYYPWWHGPLEFFEQNLNDLATRYGKDLVVVETAYPWTLAWFDGMHNLVGMPEHQLPGYPATPEGQKLFLETIMNMVAAVPNSRGRGVFYWAPEWIAAPGFGSAWENVALFDDQGSALPALEAFQAFSPVPTDPHSDAFNLLGNHPNPFNPATEIRFETASEGMARLTIFDFSGRLVRTEEILASPGPNAILWHGRDLREASVPGGVYLYRVETRDGSDTGRMVLIK